MQKVTAILVGGFMVVIQGWAPHAAAVTCNVPSTPYPTIQSALDDAACTEVILAAGVFDENPVVSRSMSVQGAGSSQTFVQGGIEVSAGAVALSGLHVSGPGEPLHAHSGAQVSGFDLVVINGVVEAPLFSDGFESGDTTAWSAATP